MGGQGNAKLNLGAMQGKMNRNVRMAKQRDRMRAKLAARKEPKDDQIALLQAQLAKAKETNRLLETMQNSTTTEKKSKRKRKRRKRRNKK